jgi:hypothetical protein
VRSTLHRSALIVAAAFTLIGCTDAATRLDATTTTRPVVEVSSTYLDPVHRPERPAPNHVELPKITDPADRSDG